MNLETLHQYAAQMLDQNVGSGGTMTSPTPGLLLLRATRPTPLEGTVYEPVLCLILHGAKQVTVGDTVVTLRAGDALIVSHDLPVMSMITSASTDEPYVAYILSLDVTRMRELREEVDAVTGSASAPAAPQALSAAVASEQLIDALGRYLTLDHEGMEGRALASTVLRETYLRLLLEPHGHALRQLLDRDSNAALVARAIARIRRDFRSPIAVADLASDVGMSSSSLHDHFRRVTSTTPLRYQKELRMQEARRLLTSGPGSVTSVATEVGYSSPSQFSREYARRFGEPPSRRPAAAAPA